MDEQRKVFVSSVYLDLSVERDVIDPTLRELGYIPVRSETCISAGMSFQDQISHSIRESEYFILIIGNQFEAGKQERIFHGMQELEYALQFQKPIMSFIHQRFVSAFRGKRIPDEGRTEEWALFIERIRQRPYRSWNSVQNLANDIKQSLQRLSENLPALFEDATSPEELIASLRSRASTAQNTYNGVTKYVCHYTKMSAVIAILKSKKWYIGSPKNMNDGLELMRLEDMHADNLFFASFCMDDKESIGMWSMYSQPWDEGVLIRIPIEKFKSWVKDSTAIYDADKKTKEAGALIENAKILYHAVAYTNVDSKVENEVDCLVCGSQQNNHPFDIQNDPAFIGYVKDIAWAYENEYRIRIETDPAETHSAVAIDIPEDVLNSFEFVTGPRFKENFLALIRQSVNRRLNPVIKESLFTGRLTWVYCDSCKYKNSY